MQRLLLLAVGIILTYLRHRTEELYKYTSPCLRPTVRGAQLVVLHGPITVARLLYSPPHAQKEKKEARARELVELLEHGDCARPGAGQSLRGTTAAANVQQSCRNDR